MSRWREVIRAPSGLKAVYARGEDEIWLVGEYPPHSRESQAVVYLYDGVRMREEFRLAEKGSKLYDIDFAGAAGWAVGSLLDGDSRKPLLVRYNGNRWEKVVNVPQTRLGFFDIAAVAASEFWVSGYEEVFHYQNGSWSRYAGLGGLKGLAFHGRASGYAWPDLGNFIWVFDGNRWVKETPELPSGFSLFSIKGGVVTVPEVYFGCSVYHGIFKYQAILKRDSGPPGQGTFELVFFGPPGPYMDNISLIAFADAKHGIAIGYLTSVVCDDGIFIEEILDTEFGNPVAVSALAPGDYWMLSKAEGVGHFLARYKK